MVDDPRKERDKGDTDFFDAYADDDDEGNEFMVAEVDDKVKNFMAVKPWKGAVFEPDSHPPVDKSKPDVTYECEYVYGYRCDDSRQNVYFNP